jgi:hypothetical protein
MSISGYFLEGVDGELLMVIRSYDEETMYSIIKKIESMRSPEIKKLAEILEMHFNERDSNGGDSSKARSQDKKKSTDSNRSRNRKTGNSQFKS